MTTKNILIGESKKQSALVQEFINYFVDFLIDEQDTWTLDDLSDQMGDWVCKYAENQEEVNDTLDAIDEVMLVAYPEYLD